MNIIDLRSDTVTKPTADVRAAMATAKVGDDVFGEDPTVNKLQEIVAEMLGKERALFVPSGTMANQIALQCHTQPGDEVICDENSHVYNYEGGAPALLSGVQIHPLPGQRGVITPEQIRSALRPPDHHFARSRLVVLENTHNRAGGAIFPLEEIKTIHNLSKQTGLKMHLDGARLWNAHVATGTPLSEYGRYFDSINVCLSKGLGAPVGSLIVGSSAFIEKAHRARKIFGGGMRQVGILAAAGLFVIKNHIERLAIDHKHARYLGEALNELKGVSVDLQATCTNIVIADFKAGGHFAAKVAELLKEQNILSIPFGEYKIRFVTHLDISEQNIQIAVEKIQKIYRQL
ncbi:low-specificity L-threonine aldolase [candidate division KSB1 bacterium]|nr:low-specificity L-threonine aldolase [candidate division KSB1 bacterium]